MKKEQWGELLRQCGKCDKMFKLKDLFSIKKPTTLTKGISQYVCETCKCAHLNKEYQPEEPENNVPESYTCEDCGKDLDMTEPDWDAELKEQKL